MGGVGGGHAGGAGANGRAAITPLWCFRCCCVGRRCCGEAAGAARQKRWRGAAFVWRAAVRLGARSGEWRARTAEVKARPCRSGGWVAVGHGFSWAPEGGAPGCVVRGLGDLPAAAAWVGWPRRRGPVQSLADPLLPRGSAPSEAG